MKEEQKYCVAAEDRSDGKRKAVSGPMSGTDAKHEQDRMKNNYQLKKYYRYFHVAKHPYKSKK
jgi:hypothetical protein